MQPAAAEAVNTENMPNKIGKLIEDNPNSTQRDKLKGNCHIEFKPDAIPNRFELFLLDDGEKKVETKEETRTYTSLPNVSPHPMCIPFG